MDLSCLRFTRQPHYEQADKMSEVVPRLVEDNALFDFIDRYQRKFAGYVREAEALADSPTADWSRGRVITAESAEPIS